MRKVVYFYGGNVADFAIPDEIYVAFAERTTEQAFGPGEDLEKARKVLERVMVEFAASGESQAMGQSELVAACYIWHYFNTTEEETRIEDDILIADQEGDGQDVTYMPLSEVELITEDE